MGDHEPTRRLGIDVGSVHVSAAVLEGRRVVASVRREHRGDLRGTLERLQAEEPALQRCHRVGITGSVLTQTAGMIDNGLAVIEGARLLLPGCRNIFFVGGQSFSLILYAEDGSYREHSVNPPCASGTGSFIDQQAERLQLAVADLARRAEAHSGPLPTIATRCAVFAKSDMIHSMQEGYSLDSVCAGLCHGVARNLVESLVKGRAMQPPLGMVGGVSQNGEIVRALEQILKTPVLVPEHGAAVGAVGAALMASAAKLDLAALFPGLEHPRALRDPLLAAPAVASPARTEQVLCEADGTEVMLPAVAPSTSDGVYLGIDIGSTSTKALLLTASGEVAGGFYTSTRGDPVAALKRLARCIGARFSTAALTFRGVATTGSGRKMIQTLFGADLDLDEITAHAKAALFLAPEVDTIIEIGGQDSKFTRLRSGQVYYSAMNYVCAAGTGSFIEEQAKRLGLDLPSFARLAFDERAPYTSDRCTVYMERDLAMLLGEGWSKGALAAAVLFSVRDNYLAKVVGKSSIGRHVVFQGATARNRALVAAFEAHLKQPIHVSPYCHLTGALGAALHCREQGLTCSSFRLESAELEPAAETCELCANRCLLAVVRADGKAAAWGMKCGREYADRRRAPQRPTAPERRYRQALAPLLGRRGDGRRGLRAGLPVALYHQHYYPLWRAFLADLGFTVVSAAPSRKTLERGKAIVNSDFCVPMVLAHGAAETLLRRKVDFLFIPAVVNEADDRGPIEPLFRKKVRDTYYCYVSQYLPSILGSLTSLELGDRLIAPLLRFGEQTPEAMGELVAEAMKHLVSDGQEVRDCFVAACQEFQRASAAWSRPAAALPEQDLVQVVLLGRPYTLFNTTANLGIPQRLEALGVELFFQDELDLTGFEAGAAQPLVEAMHWHYGKQLLRAAEWAARSHSFFPVLLTCFRCSQDAFLVSYVKKIMAHHDKPFLVLQLDEHASDVGYTTRIEAALRTFTASREKHRPRAFPPSPPPLRPSTPRVGGEDTVLIPNIGALVGAFWREAFVGAGYSALLLDTGTQALATGTQYAHGGECLPAVAVAGGAIEKLREMRLDPRRTYLYLPTVCMACNFPQFPILAETMLAAAGFPGVRSVAQNAMAPEQCWPASLNLRMIEAGISACQLHKMYHRIVPYEVSRGETDRVLAEAAVLIGRAIREGDIRHGLQEATARFAAIARDERAGRRPRIGLLGDYYVKYNDVVNQNLRAVVQELSGELIFPSITENASHFYDTDVRLHGDAPLHGRVFRRFEQRLEAISAEIIGEQAEPDWADCVAAMQRYRLGHYLPGETSLNVGRALYYLERGRVDAILHVNPIFCCPGVVSASIFRKVQADFSVPIIDIFYDGSGDANRVLIPHLHYLRERLAAR